MHISIHAHAVQGFSLKQVRSSTVRAMVCAVVCAVVCPMFCPVVCPAVCSMLCSMVCSIVCSVICSMVCSEVCAMLSPYSCPSPPLLTRTFHQEQAHAHRGKRPSICSVTVSAPGVHAPGVHQERNPNTQCYNLPELFEFSSKMH